MNNVLFLVDYGFGDLVKDVGAIERYGKIMTDPCFSLSPNSIGSFVLYFGFNMSISMNLPKLSTLILLLD